MDQALPAPPVAAQGLRGLRGWPLLRCLALYRHTPWRFGFTALLYAALNAALAWQQALLGHALADVQPGRAAEWRVALGWLAAIGAVAGARALLQYAAQVVGLVIQQQLLCTLREAIFQQVQALHLGYHWQHGAGALITRTTRDADKLRDALTSFWRQGVDSLFVVAAAMGFLLWVHPWLGLVPLALTLGALVLLVLQSDTLVELDRDVAAAYDEVNQQLAEGVHGVRVIKAFGLEAERSARFAAQVRRFAQGSERALAHAAWRIPLPQMAVGFGQVWVLGCGLWLVAQDRLAPGMLVSALLMVNLLVLRIEGIGRVIKTYADARSSAGRIWELLDERPAIAGGRQPLPAGPLGVRLDAVRVEPPGGGHPVLDGLSLDIAPGERVAVAGATGSGKSTLAGLLPRLADPAAGRVLLGAGDTWADLRTLDLAALRRRVQVVAQDLFLFGDSIADNLRLAAPDASDDELWQALEQAAAADFVRALPAQLDTRLGDRGLTLSGGQRQRLCLARAFAARPAVLVLDDATSALDTQTEAQVLGTLHGPTLLVASNRASVLAQCDRVLLLEGGRIAAAGTHAELARRHASYRELMGLDGD